ncbi:unnamed protein product [Thelazia callipaeda]|uniref:ATP-dependent Clp protease proteolytic subunit n=1 Tax=Thelazia callipaeda TaxID=103827 RepID=A0A0N5CS67_THECL|nr:unnamed protein product [Thelazia callipaeda]
MVIFRLVWNIWRALQLYIRLSNDRYIAGMNKRVKKFRQRPKLHDSETTRHGLSLMMIIIQIIITAGWEKQSSEVTRILVMVNEGAEGKTASAGLVEETRWFRIPVPALQEAAANTVHGAFRASDVGVLPDYFKEKGGQSSQDTYQVILLRLIDQLI